MDGKQARKIKASSSLGMMMDHGCDTINAFVQGITVTRLIRLNNFYSGMAILLPLCMFFFSAYEQYSTPLP